MAHDRAVGRMGERVAVKFLALPEAAGEAAVVLRLRQGDAADAPRERLVLRRAGEAPLHQFAQVEPGFLLGQLAPDAAGLVVAVGADGAVAVDAFALVVLPEQHGAVEAQALAGRDHGEQGEADLADGVEAGDQLAELAQEAQLVEARRQPVLGGFEQRQAALKGGRAAQGALQEQVEVAVDGAAALAAVPQAAEIGTAQGLHGSQHPLAPVLHVAGRDHHQVGAAHDVIAVDGAAPVPAMVEMPAHFASLGHGRLPPGI